MGFGGTGGSLPGLLPLDTKDPNAHEIFRTGDIDDDYEVEREPIARGKFASVRLARHRTTREIFAAKFIRRRRRAANLEHEARHEVAVLVLGRAAAHIVHLHQVYETRAEYIIILEFGEGGDLQRLLDDQGRLEEKTVRILLRQVLKGLEFLHQRNVAHLDIKPQNLVLMGSSVEDGVKIVDFGLSRVVHQDSVLTDIMGTPDYMAPETINLEPVGLATDMWSIGVITYVFLTGYTPFGGDTNQETFVNITQAEYDFSDDYFSDISDQAKDFISGLLIKPIKQRMTVSQSIAHPWIFDLFDPHRLSQLSEADSADSGYSTDLCSGSPPSPGTLPNGFVSDLCQYSIPEDQQVSSLQPIKSHNNRNQLRHLGDDQLARNSSTERKPRPSTAHMSINVLECLQAQQRLQSRPHRRASLIIPRYLNELDPENQNGAPFCHLDENQNSNGLYSPDQYDLSNLNACKNNSKRVKKPTKEKNPPDQNELLNMAMPWNNLCNGSYNKAISQLKSTPKKAKVRTNLGLRPELSCSMFELQPNYDNSSTCYPDMRASKHELKKSKSELRCLKNELRGQTLDPRNSRINFIAPRNDLRGSALDLKTLDARNSRHDFIVPENDLRGSTLDLKTKNQHHRSLDADVGKSLKTDQRNPKHESKSARYDLRNSKTEMRIPRPDFQFSKSSNSRMTTPRNNLVACHNNFASIPYLNMSLSQLNIAHETLDNEEESEERDVVYADCTLPRRFSRNNNNLSPMLRGNSFHMSFRRPKKRDSKI